MKRSEAEEIYYTLMDRVGYTSEGVENPTVERNRNDIHFRVQELRLSHGAADARRLAAVEWLLQK